MLGLRSIYATALPITVAVLALVAFPIGTAAQAAPTSVGTPYAIVISALDRDRDPSAWRSVVARTVPSGRLPRCGVANGRTRHDKVREWRRTLLDTNVRIGAEYEPFDLVSVRRAGIAGNGKVRKVMIDDLREMAEAARKAGKPLGVRSAHRSFATQKAIFRRESRRVGRQQALKFVARPGHSEHQMGTTIDFTAAGGGALSASFGTSPAGKWIARNGWKYGFVLSYPGGKKRASCYGYEPWHWRYFGRELAAEIQASGQVPRRYLWENFETVP
jgi:D-alanyl-D-alanine carboxypeptidase